jgi:hypothetical protein
MLHDPARHEPLAAVAWDETHVRATIACIVDGTVAAYSPDTLWAVHPRDLDPGDDPDVPATCLYFGAAGVAWALGYLADLGATAPASITLDLEALRERNRASLGDDAQANAGSWLSDFPTTSRASRSGRARSLAPPRTSISRRTPCAVRRSSSRARSCSGPEKRPDEAELPPEGFRLPDPAPTK